jgi:Uma2 family endonuclease
VDTASRAWVASGVRLANRATLERVTLPAQRRYSFIEYLSLDEDSNVKLEYRDGEIFAMAGGTPDHASLAVEVSSLLLAQVRDRGCRVFSSDLRVRVVETGLATYPDVTVVCGPLERDPSSRTTVTNPTLIVEVLSDGTQDYDRGEKARHYRRIASLRAYLLVSQRESRISAWRRTEDGNWALTEHGPGETVTVPELGLQLTVDDVYRGGLIDEL